MLRRKKGYSTPKHPWRAERIKEEHGMRKEYGLRRLKEIWKMEAVLRNWRDQAKQIIGLLPEQKEKAEKILLAKLQKFGVIGSEADLDDILSLQLRNIMEKRLQTFMYKKGMAITPKQARQFIVHNKVMVNNAKISSPSYLVKPEDTVSFVPGFAPKLVQEKEEKVKPEEK